MNSLSNFIYRKAKQEDLSGIARIVTNLIGTCNVDINDKLIKSSDDIFDKNIDTIKEEVENYYVCEADNTIVGACGISNVLTKNNYGLKLGKYREILYLAVDDKYQNRGIGTKLMRICCENNAYPIVYEAWGDNGKYVNSKFLLEKLGFTVLKNLGTSYYKEQGYCPFCVNRYKSCNSCLAEIWIKN